MALKPPAEQLRMGLLASARRPAGPRPGLSVPSRTGRFRRLAAWLLPASALAAAASALLAEALGAGGSGGGLLLAASMVGLAGPLTSERADGVAGSGAAKPVAGDQPQRRRTGPQERSFEPEPSGVLDWPELMARVSHELRTPLNAMIGFSELMDSELFGPLGHAKYQEYASHIRQSGARLLQATEDTLAMTSLAASPALARCERLPLAAVAREAFDAVRACGGRPLPALSITVADDAWVRAERRALRQLLVNLIKAGLHLHPRSLAVDMRTAGGETRFVLTAVPHEPAAGSAKAVPPESGYHLAISLARSMAQLLGSRLEVSACDEGSGWQASLLLERCSQPPLL